MTTHDAHQWSTMTAVDAVGRRFGVLRTWGSVGRVAAWSLVWVIVISVVVAPRLPSHTDRAIDADIPPSNVRYVGPVSHTDFAGFLPPSHDPDAFTVAWIGGSDIKLRGVSVPGNFELQLDSVGGRPLLVDSYNVIAPRVIDTIRAIDTASAAGADAIVVSLNPVWSRVEWSVREWGALDVANLGQLWSQPSTWSWALAMTAPDDYAWRLSRALSPIVEAQTRLNERAARQADRLDVLHHAPPNEQAPTGDPRLPAGTALWLVEEYGTDAMLTEDARVVALMGGVGVSQEQAAFLTRALLDAAERADVPVFLYTAPFSPESLANPEFAAKAADVEAYWAAFVPQIDSELVELEPRSMSRDYDATGTFINNLHMADTTRFAAVLVERLCAQWVAVDPALECT